MCLGPELLFLSTIIGTAATVGGSLMQASATKKAAEQSAQIATHNASVSLAQGQRDAEQQDRVNRRRAGEIHAAYGASGVAWAGTPLDVFQDQETESEIEKQNILYKAQMRATGYTMEAARSRSTASSASTAGILGAVAGTAQGARSLYSRDGKSLFE